MTKVPDTWKRSTLGEQCDLYQPKTIPRKKMMADGLYEVYGANGVIGKYDEFNHEDSEVLLSCRGNCGTVNVSKPKSWINGNAMVCRPKTSSLLKNYLRYYLESVNFAKVITGTAQQQITREPLSQVEIYIPPIDEQHRIVNILQNYLSRLEAALVDVEQAAERAKTLSGSIFHQAKIVNLNKNRASKFAQEITLQRGFDLPKQNRITGEVPIIASNGEVGRHHFSKVKGPGVITGRSGTIGRVHFVEKDFWPLNTTLYVKDFHGNDPEFVRYFLVNMQLQNFAGGSTVPSLDRNVLSSLDVSFPDILEQRRIVKRVKAAERQIEDIFQLRDLILSEANSLKRSLLHAAVTGQLTKEVASV
jgi:type I restriction enzyme S subunit